MHKNSVPIFVTFVKIYQIIILDTQSPNGSSVAQKIFNHLQMFQFYRDLGEYDKTLISVFKQHSFKLNDDLDVEFLKKWMKEFSKDEKCGEGYIDKWSLPSNKISRNEFVTKFEKIFVDDIEYGGQGMFSRIRVRSNLVNYKRSVGFFSRKLSR